MLLENCIDSFHPDPRSRHLKKFLDSDHNKQMKREANSNEIPMEQDQTQVYEQLIQDEDMNSQEYMNELEDIAQNDDEDDEDYNPDEN